MPANTGPGTTLWFLSDAIKRRNTLADRLIYDVGSLTAAELALLSSETNLEGAILVVEPSAGAGSVRIKKFETFRSFRSEPGELLRHFTIAGVGSSDVGAAALARSLANHLDAPVGAIVAGYGMSDLVSEAVGGWFFFGAGNRFLNLARQTREEFIVARTVASASRTPTESGGLDQFPSPETATLVRLLAEKERHIETLLGHSKGNLSIAYALQALATFADAQHFSRARNIDIITMGAVVAFPAGLQRIRQYLGSLDWFGRINSRARVPYVNVPDAQHQLNTKLRHHMDSARVLAGDYD